MESVGLVEFESRMRCGGKRPVFERQQPFGFMRASSNVLETESYDKDMHVDVVLLDWLIVHLRLSFL